MTTWQHFVKPKKHNNGHNPWSEPCRHPRGYWHYRETKSERKKVKKNKKKFDRPHGDERRAIDKPGEHEIYVNKEINKAPLDVLFYRQRVTRAHELPQISKGERRLSK